MGEAKREWASLSSNVEHISQRMDLCFDDLTSILKRYPEPMAHGPEACEPSHPLTPAVSGISLFSNPRNLESDF